MNKITLSLCAVLALALNAGAVIVDESVATVNGAPIFTSDYNKVVAAFEQQYELASPGITKRPEAKAMIEREVLQRLIEEELLYSAAENEKITIKADELALAKLESKATLLGLSGTLVDPAKGPVKNNIKIVDPKNGQEVKEKEINKRFKELLKQEKMTEKQFDEKIKKQLMSRKLVSTVVMPKAAPVTEAEIKALYDDVNKLIKDSKKNADKIKKDKGEAYLQEAAAIAAKLQMVTAEQVRIGHIFISAPSNLSAAEIKAKQTEAANIKREIDNGLDFAAAVTKYTDDKEGLAKTGGDMILIKGQAPKAIDDLAFKIAIGATAGPAKTDAGFHIIKLKEKRAAETLTFEKVQGEFGQYLAAQHQQQALIDYMKSLAAAADIKITKVFTAPETAEAAKAPEAKK